MWLLRAPIGSTEAASVSSDRRAQAAWCSLLPKMRIRSGESVIGGHEMLL
jgi:hypothetical protein